MPSHYRVIPRDFFNESKLLKCLGAFTIEMEKYSTLTVEHEHKPFEIRQMESSELVCFNYRFFNGEDQLYMFIPYNSKNPYPLYASIDGQDINVFNNLGKFSAEFIKKVKP